MMVQWRLHTHCRSIWIISTTGIPCGFIARSARLENLAEPHEVSLVVPGPFRDTDAPRKLEFSSAEHPVDGEKLDCAMVDWPPVVKHFTFICWS